MESSYIFVNGIRLHYLRWNPHGDGQPVVLLHGLASNARIWELVAPHLVDAGLVPYAPDLRGHGLTDKPDSDYGFDTYAQDLVACLDTCNIESPVLVGHSWGAMLALDYAARFPVGPRAPRALILVDGGMNQLNDAPGATWETTRERLAPPRLAGTPLEDFLHLFDRHWSAWQPDEHARSIILANFEVREDADDTSPVGSAPVERIYPHLSFDHHMQIVRAMWDFPTYERFTRLRCPVLLVPAQPTEPRSEGDEIFLAFKRRGVEQAQQRNKNLRVHWMVDSIHDIPLQHPAELAQLMIDFIGSNGNPSSNATPRP